MGQAGGLGGKNDKKKKLLGVCVAVRGRVLLHGVDE